MPFPYNIILGRKEIRRRQCRFPTILFWVGTRHCRLLYPDGAINMTFMNIINDFNELT